MTPNTFDSVEARPVPDTASRLEVAALVALLVFTVMSTLGYGFFALHPENLPSSESALRFYNISFQFFAQLHILIAFGALAIVLVRRLEAAWLPAFAAVYLLSFVFEHIGTGYGIPFGGYEYTGLLGARLGAADLAYAELTNANLSYGDLAAAVAVGDRVPSSLASGPRGPVAGPPAPLRRTPS